MNDSVVEVVGIDKPEIVMVDNQVKQEGNITVQDLAKTKPGLNESPIKIGARYYLGPGYTKVFRISRIDKHQIVLRFCPRETL